MADVHEFIREAVERGNEIYANLAQEKRMDLSKLEQRTMEAVQDTLEEYLGRVSFDERKDGISKKQLIKQILIMTEEELRSTIRNVQEIQDYNVGERMGELNRKLVVTRKEQPRNADNWLDKEETSRRNESDIRHLQDMLDIIVQEVNRKLSNYLDRFPSITEEIQQSLRRKNNKRMAELEDKWNFDESSVERKIEEIIKDVLEETKGMDQEEATIEVNEGMKLDPNAIYFDSSPVEDEKIKDAKEGTVLEVEVGEKLDADTIYFDSSLWEGERIADTKEDVTPETGEPTKLDPTLTSLIEEDEKTKGVEVEASPEVEQGEPLAPNLIHTVAGDLEKIGDNRLLEAGYGLNNLPPNANAKNYGTEQLIASENFVKEFDEKSAKEVEKTKAELGESNIEGAYLEKGEKVEKLEDMENTKKYEVTVGDITVLVSEKTLAEGISVNGVEFKVRPIEEPVKEKVDKETENLKREDDSPFRG